MKVLAMINCRAFDWMKVLAMSLRVQFCDKWKKLKGHTFEDIIKSACVPDDPSSSLVKANVLLFFLLFTER
jgi:hypothetical protein